MNEKLQFDVPKNQITSASQPGFLPKSRTLILVLTIGVLTLLLANLFIWKPILEVSQISNRNIYASHDFKYENEKATQKHINEVISSIKPTLTKDNKITGAELEALKELIQRITDVKQATRVDPSYNKGIISTDVQEYIFSLDYDEWEKKIHHPVTEILARLLAGGIPKNLKKPELVKILKKIMPPGNNELEDKAIIQIITAAFFPDKNIYYGALRPDSSSEAAKKEMFHTVYSNYLITGIDNSSIIKAKLEKPDEEKVNTLIDRTAFILRELELIKSIKRLNKLAFNVLPVEVRQIAKNMSEDKLWQTKEIALNAFEQFLNDGITEVEIENIDDNLQKYLPDDLSENQKKLIYEIISRTAKPNVILDQQRLEQLKKEAVQQVKPVYIKVYKGKLLVKKGEKLSEQKIKILSAAGVLDKKINWDGVYQIFSIVTIIVLVFMVYIYIFEKEIFTSFTNLWLICLLLLSITAISSILVNNHEQFIPVAVFAGIIAMFIGQRASVISLIFIISLYFKGYQLDIITTITLISGAIAAVILLPKVNQRINILKCGIIIAFVQVIVYNISTIMIEIPRPENIVDNSSSIIFESAMWFTSGIVFSMVILAISPLVEEFFGLVTYSRLTELGDFNQPLLRELEEKAPGTFQHSIAVSTLTEYAARKLNLDSTYCRVGSYYHDIGKMLKPEFFIENQLDKENPHDKLDDPYKSAKIIVSHARAGVTLGKKHKLPQALMPFMTEHHGTSLVSYFYYKAKQRAKEGETVDEKFFRYFGAKPQSKETALAMIADSAEAAVRSMKEKNRTTIKNKIKDIVSEKMNDGQLSESGLTTDEIAIIIDAFTHVMLEMYHKRIEYPSSKK